jgi:hypothetical protein
MPSHQDRVRRNYKEESKRETKKANSKSYFPCDLYSEHVFDKQRICIFCLRTELAILSQRS